MLVKVVARLASVAAVSIGGTFFAQVNFAGSVFTQARSSIELISIDAHITTLRAREGTLVAEFD